MDPSTPPVHLMSTIRHGRDGAPYLVQRDTGGRWRGVIFADYPTEITLRKIGSVDLPELKDIKKSSRWYDDRGSLDRWLKRNTRRRRARARAHV